MKILVFVCFIFCSCTVFGQKTKKINIYEKALQGENVSAIQHYDENNKLTNISILFTGTDNRYPHLQTYITLYSGTIIEFCEFIDKIVKFSNENDSEVLSEINGHKISTFKMLGARGVYLYETDGAGYKDLNPKSLLKMKIKLTDWCKKNNIAYE